MAHNEQREFCQRVKKIYPNFFSNKKVLDIGSLDINGSNKYFFEDCSYIGLDLGEGKNVDVISLGHLYDAPDNYFDTIISTEVFEHDMFYEKTINNIIRMLKPGGLFLFTCAAPGRPEHGTRNHRTNTATNQYSAPFLSGINVSDDPNIPDSLLYTSDEWADYYKNLTGDDFNKFPLFVQNFPDGYFEINNNAEIPSDLYFYGIKGGSKYLTDAIVPQHLKVDFSDDIFVIDSWPDNQSKENSLIDLIKRLKIYNIPILLSGHYPIDASIQKMVDYYLFDKNNPLLVKQEFNEYGINSVRWSEVGDLRIENHREFHHDYAIWETMRNAFNFCNQLGKKYIHFLEYDNLPDPIQYRQVFLERIRHADAVLYEYHKGSTFNENPYCATYIFSIKTDIAIKTIDVIKSKDEFFRNKPDTWQLEKNFLNSLRKITTNLHICKYVPNEKEFNTQAVWHRDDINRNGINIQFYLAVDTNDDIYIHVISDDNYVIEIVYGMYKKFHDVKKDGFTIHNIGKYHIGNTVNVFYQGLEIFNEFLGIEINKFRESNKLIKKVVDTPKEINISFVDGPFVEIKEGSEKLYHVQFINSKTNRIEFELDLKSNHWARASLKYYIDWVIKIKGVDNDFNYEYKTNVSNKKVLISFESKALGDTLAWMEYTEKFRVEKNCDVICSTFHNNLFRKQYPNINFIEPGTSVSGIYGLYRIGVFFTNGDYDNTKHLTDPKKEPLTKIASDILGLDYVEARPSLPVLADKKKRMVSIAVHGTAQCKYWNNPNGWQDVVDFLVNKGYEVRLLSKEEDGYMGNKNPTGVSKRNTPKIEDALKAIQESELFIGISSGLAWLSWAAGTKTILISGFTDVYTEPTKGVQRVINKNVCNSCWSDFTFDPGQWEWCPILGKTDRIFECSKEITSEQVITEIKIAFGWFNRKMKLDEQYHIRCLNPSDIREHIPTLKKYSEECNHVTEMGVRYCVSTFGLMMGRPKKLVSYDIMPIEDYNIDREDLKYIAKVNDVDYNFIVGDTTKIEIEETDFLFIDTDHTYNQLKTELQLHGNKARKYLGFHDTTSCEFEDSNNGINTTGGGRGLWPAIEEFLIDNSHWKLHARFTNNNGLTILKRD